MSLSPDMTALRILLASCALIIGYILTRTVLKPWRERRRQRRLNIARFREFAREDEMRRARVASAKNGRTARSAGRR